MSSDGAFGFEGEFQRDDAVGRQGEANKAAGRKTERTTVFRAPTYMHHRIRSSGLPDTPEADDFDAGFETWTVAYATPTGPGRCRLFARFPFRFPPPAKPKIRLGRLIPRINVPATVFRNLPDWVNHMGQLKVLDDDNIFVRDRWPRSRPRSRPQSLLSPLGLIAIASPCLLADSLLVAVTPLPLPVLPLPLLTPWVPTAFNTAAFNTTAFTITTTTTTTTTFAQLPLQERRVADVGGWRKNYVTPTGADTYVNAYRRAYDAAGPAPHAQHAVDFFRQSPLSKEALLDRYTQHTAHCTSCSGALRNAKRVSAVCKVALLAVAAALPSLAILRPLRVAGTLGLAAAVVVASAAWRFATIVEQKLTSGMSEYPPPRNLPQGAKGTARELRTVEEGRTS